MTIWKIAKDFRHVERIINHFEHDIKRGLEAKSEPVLAAAENLIGVSEAIDFKAMDIARKIGRAVAKAAQEEIASKTEPVLSDARIEIRERGGIAGRPEPNVRGPEKPLISSDNLLSSITWGARRTLDGVDIDIGVPIDSPAGDYAALQELGGITAADSAIPNKPVPPRPFLVPGLVSSIPVIENAMIKWLEFNAMQAARTS